MTIEHITMRTREQRGVEFLVYQGLLTADLVFEPLMPYSAFVLQQPEPRLSNEYFLELRNDQDQPLNRQPTAVFDPIICHDYQPSVQHVYGRIALSRAATRLLFFKNDILIDERSIPDAPTISLGWTEGQVARLRTYRLKLQFSKPGPGAYLLLYYTWRERKYRPIDLMKPRNEIAVSFDNLPGGEACRLQVAYTNGMRTTIVATNPFSVPERDPLVQILSPSEGQRFVFGQPISAVGQVARLDGRSSANDDLIWLLDGKLVKRGRLATLPEMPPGEHELMLCWREKKGVPAQRLIHVLERS